MRLTLVTLQAYVLCCHLEGAIYGFTDWHKIVWQNAASHMIWARVPALAAAVSQNAFIEGLAWAHWTTEKIPRNLIRFE